MPTRAIPSGERETAPLRRLPGWIALVAYGLTVGGISVGAAEFVGEVASHVLGRRMLLGAVLQVIVILVVVTAAGYFADFIICHLKRDWTVLVSRRSRFPDSGFDGPRGHP